MRNLVCGVLFSACLLAQASPAFHKRLLEKDADRFWEAVKSNRNGKPGVVMVAPPDHGGACSVPLTPVQPPAKGKIVVIPPKGKTAPMTVVPAPAPPCESSVRR